MLCVFLIGIYSENLPDIVCYFRLSKKLLSLPLGEVARASGSERVCIFFENPKGIEYLLCKYSIPPQSCCSHDSSPRGRAKALRAKQVFQHAEITDMTDAKRPPDKMALYHFEGMMDELFTELCQHPSFGSFQCYEAELREWNSVRTRTYYVEILKREMEAANQRKQYRFIIQYLGNLSTYPDGHKAATELAEYWYVVHRNRPAMKDELLQAGYPQRA